MSSTKRGGQRTPADNYPTPGWCVRRFLELFLARNPDALTHRSWFEPGAGEGNIIRTANAWFNVTDTPGPTWDANDLRPECLPWLKDLGVRTTTIDDFIAGGPPPLTAYDLVITNPPFSITMEFIRRSLELDTRYVVMLQRLNYIGTETRFGFMKANPPDMYVLPNRPSFQSSGKTDSIEYAWFVWDKLNLARPNGLYTMLGLTSKEERNADLTLMHEQGIFPEPTQDEETTI